MDWSYPALIATITCSTVLALVYFYLYHQERERSLGIWAASWLAYAARLGCALLMQRLGSSATLLIGYQLFALISGILLTWGTYVWLGWRVPGPLTWLCIPLVLWIPAAVVLQLPFWVLALPTFTVLGVAHIWAGVSFLRHKRPAGLGQTVTGWLLIVWGVHKFDYPFLVTVAWFAPWGYYISSLLSLLAALAIILLHFERTKRALTESEERYRALADRRTEALQAVQERLLRQESLAVLGQLAGGVGHELRNPLGVIANAVYFLKTTHADADDLTLTYLNIIDAEVRNATKIVTDLLDFARGPAVDRQRVALGELIPSLLLRSSIPANVQVVNELSPDLPTAHADPGHVEQVLRNLITNACQAMPDGGTVTLRAQAGENEVAISVADTGHGVAQENLSRLFEPLFSTKPRGIGLGLAVSQKLVQANDGHITVQSTEGVGTVFTVYLPTTRDAGGPP